MPHTGRYQTGDPSLLRHLNLAVVMRCLRDCAPIYRAQVAEITGLNKTTVSSLVSDLIAQEFVLEREPGTAVRANGKTGRPAVMLELNPDAGFVVAAEVGVDYLSVAVANFTGNVIWRQTERTRHLQGQHAIIDRLLALLQLAIWQVGVGQGPVAQGPLAQGTGAQGAGASGVGEPSPAGRKRLLGIAVGVPGLIAVDTGSVLFAPNLSWRDVPLGSMLRKAFDCPIYLDNEANLAAVAEAQYGVAKGHRDVLYISAGVGLGGGIIRNGQLYRGVSGFAGEFGHMRVFTYGEPIAHGGPFSSSQPGAGDRRCGCGNSGCWETLVSERALFADIRRRIAKGEASLLAWAASDDPLASEVVGSGSVVDGKQLDEGRLMPDGKRSAEPAHAPLTVPVVVAAAQSGDQVAMEALRTVGRALGSGIASLVNALNPELVVLGGSLSVAGEFLLPAIESVLLEHALRWSRAAARVVIAQHRFDACVMGGIATVIEESQMALAHPGQINGLTWAGAQVKGREHVGPSPTHEHAL